MAELQWVIEVRCVNTLLAQIKVGERGQHFIVDIPAGDFDPSEFAKLIEGVEVAKALGKEHYVKTKTKAHITSHGITSTSDVGIIEERELYDIQLLATGELALVTITTQQKFFAPSELDRFLQDLKKAQQEMNRLREC